MVNSGFIDLKRHSDSYGNLVAIEESRDIPFDIKRVYYIYKVDEGVRRGFHSHRNLHQVLICVHGSVKILVKNPEEEEIVTLNDPSKGLYIGPMLWREMYDFEDGAVLLVLASEYYDISDYIREYADYEKEAKEYVFDNSENLLLNGGKEVK
ncbi:MAG: FdtA/QdtA family cupin domain-containing protein [Lachnospiraceae bacterium]|nr:FdtA/QdtA family cupin domain-containing protein [Lachnospiraceae bacterium]